MSATDDLYGIRRLRRDHPSERHDMYIVYTAGHRFSTSHPNIYYCPDVSDSVWMVPGSVDPSLD